MTPELKTIIYPVRDAASAKAMFGALLDREPVIDEPYYIHFDVDGFEVGLDPNGHTQGLTMPVSYWHVDDIEATVAALVATIGADER